MFCRHNRLTGKCPICRKELEQQLPQAPPRMRRASGSTTSSRRPASPARTGGSARKSSGRLVTRKLARAADDGYRNPLVPGLRATADAERLAMALTEAAARLLPPGPHPEVATEPDVEEALWLAFLLALAGPRDRERQARIVAERPSWRSGDEPDLPAEQRRTAIAYRAWAQRSGSQAAAYEGEAAWTPQRRFARLFERLSLPGFGRERRFDLLTTVDSSERFALQADALHFGAEDDATTTAAKRLLVSGDRMLLERRARELAAACALPLAALDRGLAVWGEQVSDLQPGGAELPVGVRRALKLP